MGARAGRGRRDDATTPRRPAEPVWRKAARDLVSLAFVIGAIVFGIRAGHASDDVGLGIGVGFAICFVGAIVISHVLLAPDQRPAPRWAVVLSLVTSPLVIAAGVIEMRADDQPSGDLRLFCGVAGLLFGLDQWAQRGRLRRRVRAQEAARERAAWNARFPVVPPSVFVPLDTDPASPALPPCDGRAVPPARDVAALSGADDEADEADDDADDEADAAGREIAGDPARAVPPADAPDRVVPRRRGPRLDGRPPRSPGEPGESGEPPVAASPEGTPERHLRVVGDDAGAEAGAEAEAHGHDADADADDDRDDERGDEVDLLPPHRW